MSKADTTYHATLLVRLYDVIAGYECGAVQVTYEGSLVDVTGATADSTFLVLNPLRQMGDGGVRDAEYYSALFLLPGRDGTLVARVPNLLAMQLRQSSDDEDGSARRLAQFFQTLPVDPPEFVPQRDMTLYNAIGDFIGDDLSVADVRAQQLRLYSEGPVVAWRGIEFRRVIVVGPNYRLRKAWARSR